MSRHTMNASDVRRIAIAFRCVRPAFPGVTPRERVAAEIWAICVTAVCEVFAKHARGFERARFFRDCGITLVASFREH